MAVSDLQSKLRKIDSRIEIRGKGLHGIFMKGDYTDIPIIIGLTGQALETVVQAMCVASEAVENKWDNKCSKCKEKQKKSVF